jgi:hypothetical protein
MAFYRVADTAIWLSSITPFGAPAHAPTPQRFLFAAGRATTAAIR